jgi:CTP synthase (UTP-ammonia lyase)
MIGTERTRALLRIGIIGDFNSKHHTHVAINAAIDHAAAALGDALGAEWLPTPALTKPGADQLLSRYDALWAAPASPYESGEGMLRGIEYARTHNVPFTGT